MSSVNIFEIKQINDKQEDAVQSDCMVSMGKEELPSLPIGQWGGSKQKGRNKQQGHFGEV
jgi:hypothetical protein